MSMKRLFAAPLLSLALCGNAWALFGNEDVSRRLEALERKVESGLSSDLVGQVESLRREVQQLRGEMEVMQHQIQTLQRTSSSAPPVSQAPATSDRFVTTDRNQNPGRVQSAQPPVEPAVQDAAGDSLKMDSPRPVSQASVARQETDYQNAFDLLKAGRYPQAEKAFRGFLDAHPGSSFAGNAQYWLGESYYVQNQYDQALREFAQVIKQYPQSGKVPDAMLKMGYIQYDKKAYGKARQMLEDLIARYPQGTSAILARKQLDRMHKGGH
jgi:tol-pal system protein YbgF